MARYDQIDDGGSRFPPLPRVTKGVLIVYVACSLLAPLLGGWLQLLSLPQWFAFAASDLWAGHVWRLFTWPWIAGDPLTFIFSGLMLWWFLGDVEQEWGSRRTLRRLPFMLAIPALLTGLLGLVIQPLASIDFLGPNALVAMVIVAFASANPYRQIRFFLAPAPLSGDQLIVLEGVILGIFVLFSGTILGHMLSLAAFGVALAWFRFEWDRFVNVNPRRTYLKLKKKRLQAKLKKLEKNGTLRVVRDDDDPPKYLN